MRKRLYCVFGGAFLALGLNPVIGPMIGMEGGLALLAMVGVGAVLGAVVSIVLDVFLSEAGKLNVSP